MSEEPQDPNNATPQPSSPAPSKRLITGAVNGTGKPRILTGGSAPTGNLKIAMSPEQEAAIARAKAQRDAAELAQKQEEERMAAEQARYEAELKAYQEYEAAMAAQAATAQAVEAAPAPVQAQPVAQAPAPTPTPEQAQSYQGYTPATPMQAPYPTQAPEQAQGYALDPTQAQPPMQAPYPNQIPGQMQGYDATGQPMNPQGYAPVPAPVQPQAPAQGYTLDPTQAQPPMQAPYPNQVPGQMQGYDAAGQPINPQGYAPMPTPVQPPVQAQGYAPNPAQPQPPVQAPYPGQVPGQMQGYPAGQPTGPQGFATPPTPAQPPTPPIPTPSPIPTSQLTQTSRLGAGSTSTTSAFSRIRPATEEDFGVVPLWKKKVFYLPVIFLVIAMGIYFVVLHNEKKAKEERIERLTLLREQGSDRNQKNITASQKDLDLLLSTYKETDDSWQATAEAIKKIMNSGKFEDLPLEVLRDMTDNYKSYLSKKKKNGTEKIERLYAHIVSTTPPSRPLKEAVFKFMNSVPVTFKPYAVRYSYPVMNADDMNMYAELINKGDCAKEAIWATNKLIEQLPDKQEVISIIRNNYNEADGNLKNVYIRIMGGTRDKMGLDFLSSIVKDKNSTDITLTNVIMALGTWPNDDVIDLIMKLKDDERVKKSADLQKKLYAQMLRTLDARSKQRDMAKYKPLFDYLMTLTEPKEKQGIVTMLSYNYNTADWAIKALEKFIDDTDSAIATSADNALRKVQNNAPPKAEEKKSEEKVEDDEIPVDL